MRGVGDRLSHYRSWIACCLSRGHRAPLGESDVAELVDEVGERSYAGGTCVFNRGDKAAMVHIVRTGSVELSRHILSRHIKARRVALQILHPGDAFGDVPLFLGEPEPFDALVSMAARMAGLQARLVDLLAGQLDAQLASILLREAEESGEVKLTHRHLSDLVGAASTEKGIVMVAVQQIAARPTSGTDPSHRSKYRTVGLFLALVGLLGTAASVIGNFVAGVGIDAQNSYAETLAWTFGLSIFSFGVVKIAIAIILMGIIVRIWHRIDAVPHHRAGGQESCATLSGGHA